MAQRSVWNLPGGPWDRLFAGIWNGYNVAVYENPNKTLLTTIFPKVGSVNWIMIRVDHILLVPKDFEKIESKLAERKMNVLKQRVAGKGMTYLMLLSDPETVDFGSKEIGEIVFNKDIELEREVDEIKAIGRKAKVEILELKDASYKESAGILGNPTMLLGMLSVAPGGDAPKKEMLGEISLGKTDDGIFSVSPQIFSQFCGIKGGKREEQAAMMQLIAEEAIIDAPPIPIIFDFGDVPLKLDVANPYPYDYSEYGLSNHPGKFKINHYELTEDACPLKINLNTARPELLVRIFGLGKDNSSLLILESIMSLKKTKREISFDSIKTEAGELAKSIGKENALPRACDLLRALSISYDKIISNSSDAKSEIVSWIHDNKTVYLAANTLNNQERFALSLYLFDIIESEKGGGNLDEIDIKRAENIYPLILNLSWMGDCEFANELIKSIVQMGRGVFADVNKIPIKLESVALSRIQVLGLKKAKYFDCGRGTEFEPRPLLSCPP